MPTNSRQFRADYLGNPNLPTEHAEFEYTEEQVKEIAKCSKDILHFANGYFYIVTADEGKKKIELYKTQKRVLAAAQKYRYMIVLQPRQTAKCCLGSTIIKIKNKKTGEIKEITLEELYKLKKKNKDQTIQTCKEF